MQRLSMLVCIRCAGFYLAQRCGFHALPALCSIAEVICACAGCNLGSACCHTECTLYLPLLSCNHAYSRHAAATHEADRPLPAQIPKSEQKARKKEITVG